jgi:hypothetical protein
MKNQYRNAVKREFGNYSGIVPGLLTEGDLEHLPEPVRKYIRFTGSVGKPRVWNFRSVFTGGIRSGPADAYMPLRSVQYNFIARPARLFYIVARKMGIPAKGFHEYSGGKASMVIKILGLFKVVDARGHEMDQGETVTFFNDMCFMAPATLTDPRIHWQQVDERTVNATFSNGKLAVRSTLYFDADGRLVDFLSNDRFETSDGKNYNNYPWLTPVSSYSEIKGYTLPSAAKLIYRHPDMDFCYGEFKLVDIEYNCSKYGD